MRLINRGKSGKGRLLLNIYGSSGFNGPFLEQIPPKLKTLAIRICSKILIWRESFSAKRFRFAGKRAKRKPRKGVRGLKGLSAVRKRGENLGAAIPFRGHRIISFRAIQVNRLLALMSC